MAFRATSAIPRRVTYKVYYWLDTPERWVCLDAAGKSWVLSTLGTLKVV